MPAKIISRRDLFPVFLLSFSVFFTIFVLGWMGWSDYRNDRDTQSKIKNYLEIERLRGAIVHLDELLTMSARMAAVTGDLSWDKRYHQSERKLSQTIQEIASFISPHFDARIMTEVNSSHAVLVKMEKEALLLVHQGLPDQARKILFGREYEAQKSVYAKGIEVLSGQLNQVIEEGRQKEIRQAFLEIVSFVSIIFFLLLGWRLVMRVLFRYQKTLMEKNRQLACKTSDLEKTNFDLDRKVTERTRDLEISRNDALHMMAEAEAARQKTQQALETLEYEAAQRKRLEGQFLESQKMEAIGRLSGGIAHDFNNLLTVINGYADFHINQLPKGDPLRADLEEILSAGHRAASLTNQLLTFSRRKVMQSEVVNFNQLILNLEKMLKRIIGEDIEMISRPGEGLWSVKVDPVLIEQVIMNLVVNARDAMPERGKLVIETRNVVLGEEYCREHLGVIPGNYAMIAVSDTGCGITPEVRAHIFEPFFTTKPKGKGTGLGLATCYGIAQQFKGHIEVYSEPGQGSTFKIYIPESKEERNVFSPKNFPGDSPGGTETILLAEDESLVRQLASKILTQKGYTVLEASNGQEALDLAIRQSSNQKIDLLLTDVVMPQMGGLELSEKIKAIYPSIKVLFASGYANDVIVHHGMLNPDVNFISKPFLPQALALKVRKILDR